MCTSQPAGAHLGGDRLYAANQVAVRAPGVRIQISGVTEHALDQGHVLSAPAHHLSHVIAASTCQGRERVEDRVVQQALVLALFDVLIICSAPTQ
jgi:hypothetical protein